ncbi:MAG: RNA polymerase factor sigma-54 [Rhodobacter sp.]|nr:RNA polymerase factor sigma-54 [Rhodobacter sp.]MCA3494665.1 RNA polymerase factor sigma-54 [Rhodobacter sp.]MCA3498952.1 RNA polymerase factor sigma-54 [Rhodobacter sp.]MCA3503873.1 RNA polymerase factor sigma-54 [Rhodobacter sp.]MCA3517482.1 RNA polymerase factor sigma-54 [Rhodobacter sp.]
MTRQRIGLTQTQRLQLTPGLQQSIRLLRMDAGGLTRFLEEQAARNPFLAVEEPPVLPATWLPRWGAAFAACRCSESGRSDPAMPAPSLMAHVLTQIRALACAPAERQIALVLAEALDPSGWLGRPLADLARQANCSVAQAEAVLMRLQRIEPTGLFARSLAECLRLQAQEADRLDPVMQRVLENLEMVASGQIGALARLCAVPESDVMARLRVIRSFNPKPGAQFDPVNSDTHEPDLIVTEGAAGWEVQLNRSALPALSVRRPQGRLTAQAERAALAEALGLCRIVERRNTTLLRVAHEVLQRQTAALDRGLAGLRPMTLADVAGALNLHESTVSRLVAGVSIATPQGTWQLRALFGPQVGDRSAAAIRAEIAHLVAAENPARPLTDRAITEALLASGREVARRTVAKYRDMLRIPPAGSRRRLRRR